MLHDVHQWRSLPEVDTWLMSFNMTCFALWVFAMIFCQELDILVWSLDDMHVFGSNMTWIGFYIWSEPSFDKTAQIWKLALSHAYIFIYYLWQCFDYAMTHLCALCLISSLWHSSWPIWEAHVDVYMLCHTQLHFHLDSYIVNKREKRWRGELNEKFRKMHPHVQGEFAFVQGELSCCF
jgi:hypothetical protein